MCGITGYLSTAEFYDESVIKNMVKTITHRGPDDYGVKLFNEANFQLCFGHTRLSILDVSNGGHQPMQFENLWIVYNGEVYNFKDIKEELISLGHKFVSQSDTEVILHAFKEWDIDAVHKFIGMFVFNIYDENTQEFYVFRDRAGVKPLYYYNVNGLFMFASELKTFHEHPEFKKEINEDALYQFFKYGFIHAPNSIFKNVKKLLPGHFLKYSIKKNSFEIKSYWNVLDFYKKPKLEVSFADAKSHLKTLMKDAFKLRMVADVPVGVFLSGGYDSSVVSAILQDEQSTKLKTFTIGFNNKKYDESMYAEQVADILETEQHTFICSDKEALDIIPKLPFYFDEPFGDPSAIPTMLLSEKAREKVTVSLSADGGDEIFFGYTRHEKIHRYYNRMKKLGMFGKVLSLFYSFKNKNKLNDHLYTLNTSKPNVTGRFLDTILQRYKDSYLKSILNKGNNIASNFNNKNYNGIDKFKRILAIDYTTYMADDILVKVDRATMSASLEGREPLLDHRITEYVAQLPFEYLYDEETKSKKHILKEICHDYIPKEVMDRKKVGFTPPISEWLKNELKDFTINTLSKEELSKHNFLNITNLHDALDKFLKGNNDYYDIIWNAIVFQLWYNKWMINEK